MLAPSIRLLTALGQMFQTGNASTKRTEALQVAAFSNPTASLSWTLHPVHGEVVHFAVVDVVTSNHRAHFGLFENPYCAHTTYDLNPFVLRALVCGKAGLAAPC